MIFVFHFSVVILSSRHLLRRLPLLIGSQSLRLAICLHWYDKTLSGLSLTGTSSRPRKRPPTVLLVAENLALSALVTGSVGGVTSRRTPASVQCRKGLAQQISKYVGVKPHAVNFAASPHPSCNPSARLNLGDKALIAPRGSLQFRDSIRMQPCLPASSPRTRDCATTVEQPQLGSEPQQHPKSRATPSWPRRAHRAAGRRRCKPQDQG